MAVAAGVVFYGLLALFPAVTAFVSLYGLIADASTVRDHLSLASGILPDGALQLVCGSLGNLFDHLNCQDIVSFMNDVELTEEWLFERLRVNEERKFRDPEDAYLEVRRQEAERAEKGLPPLVQFLKEANEDTAPNDKTLGDEAL